MVDRAHPDLLGLLALVADVDVRGGVVADQHRREPGDAAAECGRELGHAGRHPRARPAATRLAVDHPRAHASPLGDRILRSAGLKRPSSAARSRPSACARSRRPRSGRRPPARLHRGHDPLAEGGVDDVVADRVRNRRRGGLLGAGAANPEPWAPSHRGRCAARLPPPGAQPVGVVAIWRSIRRSGISPRKREGRFQLAAPCRRAAAREGHPEALAGPGNADVTEPALLLEVALLERAQCGKTPSSQPIMNTASYSRPFALWSDISVARLSSVTKVSCSETRRDLGEELLHAGRRPNRPRARGWRRTRRRRRPAPRGSRSGPPPRSCVRPRAPRGSRSREAPPRAARRPRPRARIALRRPSIVSANRPHRLQRRRAEPGDRRRTREHVPDVLADGVRVREQPRLGRSPIPRRGELTTPRERDRVGGIREQLQVGDRVLDLGPLVELGPPDHLVGDLEAHQGVLEHPALGVDAVEDGDLGRAAGPLLDQPVDLRGHVARLGVLVVELGDRPPARRAAPSVHRCLASGSRCGRSSRWRRRGSSVSSGSSAPAAPSWPRRSRARTRGCCGCRRPRNE